LSCHLKLDVESAVRDSGREKRFSCVLHHAIISSVATFGVGSVLEYAIRYWICAALTTNRRCR